MEYRIRELRKARGWTLEQLAAVVGTSKGYLSDLERGRRIGGIEMLRAIAVALDINENEIFKLRNDEGEKIKSADEEISRHLEVFSRLSPQDRQTIERIARSLANANNDE